MLIPTKIVRTITAILPRLGRLFNVGYSAHEQLLNKIVMALTDMVYMLVIAFSK
jgi:hypothetical protein